MPCFDEKDGYILLNVRVVPNASSDGIQGLMGDALKIRIQAPPVDGKANAYLIKYLSRHWNISRRSIRIIAGETGRSKRLRIDQPSDELRKELLSIESG
ncbi:MAG: YggU family protein [Pontiella sp.]|nr:YggU family protein [Pontiella sp.]